MNKLGFFFFINVFAIITVAFYDKMVFISPQTSLKTCQMLIIILLQLSLKNWLFTGQEESKKIVYTVAWRELNRVLSEKVIRDYLQLLKNECQSFTFCLTLISSSNEKSYESN